MRKTSFELAIIKNLVLKISILFSLATSLHTNSTMAQANEFSEVFFMCKQSKLYGELALNARDSGVEIDKALILLNSSMDKNLKNLSANKKEEFKTITNTIYKNVYSNHKVDSSNINDIIFDACSNHTQHSVNKKRLKHELASLVPSAFEPNSFVHFCTKAGETSANIAVARDRGVSKNEITKLANKMLKEDPHTKEILPQLISDVYDNVQIKVKSFYEYNRKKCFLKESGTNLLDISVLASAIERCQNLKNKARVNKCWTKLFRNNTTKRSAVKQVSLNSSRDSISKFDLESAIFVRSQEFIIKEVNLKCQEEVSNWKQHSKEILDYWYKTNGGFTSEARDYISDLLEKKNSKKERLSIKQFEVEMLGRLALASINRYKQGGASIQERCFEFKKSVTQGRYDISRSTGDVLKLKPVEGPLIKKSSQTNTNDCVSSSQSFNSLIGEWELGLGEKGRYLRIFLHADGVYETEVYLKYFLRGSTVGNWRFKDNKLTFLTKNKVTKVDSIISSTCNQIKVETHRGRKLMYSRVRK